MLLFFALIIIIFVVIIIVVIIGVVFIIIANIITTDSCITELIYALGVRIAFRTRPLSEAANRSPQFLSMDLPFVQVMAKE